MCVCLGLCGGIGWCREGTRSPVYLWEVVGGIVKKGSDGDE